MLEAAVIGVPGEKWGDCPLVIVVPVEGAGGGFRLMWPAGTSTELRRRWGGRHLAVPDHYTFAKELPKTSGGKIEKRALRSRYPAAPTD